MSNQPKHASPVSCSYSDYLKKERDKIIQPLIDKQLRILNELKEEIVQKLNKVAEEKSNDTSARFD